MNRHILKHCRNFLLAALAMVLANQQAAVAQDASLLLRPTQQQPAGLTLENSSFLYRELPPESRARELQINDIITVLVDYRTRLLSEGDAESRKRTNLTAVLADWVRLRSGDLKPAPQSDGDPSITGTVNSLYRAESDIETLDSLTFRVAAKIVDIRPNGNLVIEAHQNIRINEEVWEISLTGVVRREAIQADRTVSSDAIAELKIVKNEQGQVHDGYARGWLKRIYDRFHFF